MKKLKAFLGTVLLVGISYNTLAVEPEYNADSKLLTIPKVKFGNSFLYDAVLELNGVGGFDIVGYSETPTNSNVDTDAKCTEDKITLEKYKQITDEMSLEQVNNIIGCKGELTIVSEDVGEFYKWAESGLPSIEITFQNNVIVSRTYYP